MTLDSPKLRLFRSEASIRLGTNPDVGRRTAGNPTGLNIISTTNTGINLPTYFNYLILQAATLGSRSQGSTSVTASLKDRGSHISMNIGGRVEAVGLPAISAANRMAGFDYSGVKIGNDYPTYNDQPYFVAIDRYLNGDHWQDGVAWRGPLPATLDTSQTSIETAKITMKLIEGAFISRNFYKECLGRHVASVVGLPPTRTIAESLSSQKKRINSNPDKSQGVNTVADHSLDPELSRVTDAMDAAIRDFWSYSSVHEHLQKATAEACAFEHGFLRWFRGPQITLSEPEGLAEEDIDLGQSVAGYLRGWRVHYVDPKVAQCAVYTDDADVPVAAYYVRMLGSDLYQEFQIVDSAGITNVMSRVTDFADNEEIPFELQRYNMRGNLLIHAMRRDTIFTPQFAQNNDAINVVYTVAGRSNIQASFLERVITNAQLDGYYEDFTTANGQTVKRFVPFPMPGGAGTTKSLQGVKTVDPDTGNVTNIANPGVYWKDPISMTHFIDSKDLFMENIYAEIGQAHVRINNSTAPSGYARETASQDGSNFLQPTILMASKALDWLDAITKAIIIKGAANKELDIELPLLNRIVISTVCATIDKIPSTEDKRVARELFDAGIWTFERANYATGAANPAQEKRKMLQERSEGFGNNSYASRENATQIAQMNIDSQQKIAKENALRPQANSRSQATTGGGKGSNQANKVDGTPSGMGAGPNPRKPVSPNTSTPAAGRKPNAGA